MVLSDVLRVGERTMSVQRPWRRAGARVLTGLAAAALVIGTSGAAPPARAADVYVPWSSLLPGWTDDFRPSSANDCVAGRPQCLRATLKELARIFDRSAQDCTHAAPFALAYLRITQTYGWSRDLPGYYDDVAFANHQDAVFAKYFTDAYTHWSRGDRSEVPQAWLTAFDAGQDRRVSGTGDLLLGMNAHINRDLPYVIASVGLVAPDGSSRKPDYDQVEDFLYRATAPLIAEAAARFDPAMDDASDPLELAYAALFQIISAGRENAWRNAEALVNATSPAQRARVSARIDAEAEATAQSILVAQGYLFPVSSTRSRDSWCTAHRGDAAPQSYPFGRPDAYGS